jgi:glycosyltransferase involved in cell wall biosynthesis
MRILMLNNEFPPLGGGTGTVNLAMLQRFAQVPGLEIDLITSGVGRMETFEDFTENIRISRFAVNNKNLHHSTNDELLTYSMQALYAAQARHRSHSYDLCFAWSAVPAGGVALVMSRFTRLPYLVRVCGPDIPGFEQRYKLLYPVLTPMIRAIWRRAETVVAKCQGEADMIHAIDKRAHVTLIPNGVDLAAFTPAPPIDDDEPLRIICVARLIERKGQHHLISAVRRLVDEGIDVVLELVGTGDAQAANQQQAHDLGVSEQVHFVGYVPREEIAAHYAAAHVFVLPSYNEGMSVATLEAMAAGLPVVITRTGGSDELVAEGENGFVFEWGDVDALVGHLRRLETDRALTRQMAAASRQRAARFSWDAAAQSYLVLFERIIECHRSNYRVKKQ